MEVGRYLHVIWKTKVCAKTVVYWMGMNADIAEMISKCNTCTDFRNKNPKEPKPIPDGPWQLVGSDLFTLNNEDYFVIVDCYSKFFELGKLEDIRSKTVT